MHYRGSGLALAAVLAICGGGVANAQQQQNYEQWLGEQFQRVARSCLPTTNLNHPPARFIPADVRGWDSVSGELGANATIYSLDSLSAYFGTVWVRAADRSISSARLQPLGVTYSESEATALYPRRANGTRQHNCSTMFTASGGVSLNAGAFRAAVNSSISGTQSETIFLYSGSVVSPVAAALGLATTEVERRPNVDRFSVYLAVWDWYRLHAARAVDGNEGRLEITRSIDGAATYRVRGLTQDLMMTGNARAGGGVPFVTANASTNLGGAWTVRDNMAGFGVAVLRRHPGTLPGPRNISENAPLLATVTPAQTNPTSIDSAAPINWAADLSGVPSGFCDRRFWKLKSPADGATGFTLDNFDAAPVAEQARVCRFSVRATPRPAPSAGASNVAGLSFAVMSEIPGAADRAAPPLVIPVAATEIADLRASISLANPTADIEVVRPLAGRENLLVPLTYVMREQSGSTATDISPGSAALQLTCNQNPPQDLVVAAEDVLFARASGQGRLVVTARIPAGSIPDPTDGPVSCQLSGSVTMTVRQGAPRPLRLPTHAFTVVSPPAPPSAA